MESLGARLKRERERQGIALDDVALATKIGVRMLQAIEEEHFDRLPGGVFNKGFVRAYARHLGLDEEQALADYLAATGGTAPPPVEPESIMAVLAAQVEEVRAKEKPSRTDGFPWGKLAIALLVVAFGLALWSSRSRRSDSHVPKNSAKPAAQPTSSSAAPAIHQIETPTSEASAPQPEPPPAMPADVTATPTAQAPEVKGATFSVLVQAQQDSWVSIHADGREVLHQLLTARSEKSIEAQQEIVIKAGNIGGLRFWLNGKPQLVQGSPDQVKTVVFVPSGLQKSDAVSQPHSGPGQ